MFRAPKPAGNSFFLGATAGTVGLLGVGASIYAKFDESFRKGVEDNVPLAKDLFDALYGDVQKKNSLMPTEKDLSIPFLLEVWII